MKKFAAFGELMLRLSPPQRESLFQSPRLEATFGGAEANVAVSLARFGHEVRFISVIPANEIGDAAVRELRRAGVGTEMIVRQGRRLGIYFAETGSNQRPSKVIYDRDHAAVADARPGDIDWVRAFDGREAFHVTGITPALSAIAAELTSRRSSGAAKNLQVSVDLIPGQPGATAGPPQVTLTRQARRRRCRERRGPSESPRSRPQPLRAPADSTSLNMRS
jgi:2-dehydro-3-deoxygluconokinase